MKAVSVHTIAAASALELAITLAGQAGARGELVALPVGCTGGVRYAIAKRGDINEGNLTSRDAIEAGKRGQPLPSGTVITLVDCRDGKIVRFRM